MKAQRRRRFSSLLQLAALAFAIHGGLIGSANAAPAQPYDGAQFLASPLRMAEPSGGLIWVAHDSYDLQPPHISGLNHKVSGSKLYNSTPKGGHGSSAHAVPKMAHASPKATAHAVSAKPAHAVMAKGSGLTQAVPQTAPSLVERVQTALAKLGDYPGKVDGILGPETIKALSSFQQAQGLPQTGRADVATIERLGVSILP